MPPMLYASLFVLPYPVALLTTLFHIATHGKQWQTHATLIHWYLVIVSCRPMVTVCLKHLFCLPVSFGFLIPSHCFLNFCISLWENTQNLSYTYVQFGHTFLSMCEFNYIWTFSYSTVLNQIYRLQNIPCLNHSSVDVSRNYYQSCLDIYRLFYEIKLSYCK